MVKFALTTAESTIVTHKGHRIPCVILFGRDEKGNRRKWRAPYWPYCYLNEAEYIRLKDLGFLVDKGPNRTHHILKSAGARQRSLTKRALTKIWLEDSKYITDFERVLRKHQDSDGYKDPVFTYEADLSKPGLFALRFLIDKKIRSGVNINDRTGELRPIEFIHPLRKWYLDFEAYSTKQCSYGPKPKEPITMATYWDTYDKQLITLFAVNSKWDKKTLELCSAGKLFKPVMDNHLVLDFKTESMMLDYMVEDVIRKDPDMFTAWNLDRYDMVKWKQRMDANRGKCIYSFKDLSPMKSLLWNRRPYRIKGRISFDLLKGFKRFTDAELRSYSLLYVAESEGFKIEKVPFVGTAGNTWDKYPQVVFRRNVNDVLIIKALDEKYGLVEMFDDLKREFGALFHEILMNYRVLDTALMRFINSRTVLKSTGRSRGQRESFLGAVVIKPKVGPHVFTTQFDFTREYPNIIKAFNISPETYRDPEYEGECHIVKYRDVVYKFVKSPIGLLPRLINSFFRKRDKYEDEYALAIKIGNKAKIKMWWRRVFNIKKMTNAIYGVMDFPSFRLHKTECSAATAAIGRISIEELEQLAIKFGYELEYGDTDSIFIDLKSTNPEDSLKEGLALVKKLNDGLVKFFIKKYGIKGAPSELGLKKIYERYLLLGRKNYAGKSIWDEKKGWKVEYDFKGFEAIRSDSSNVEKEVLEKIVKMWLNGESVSSIMEYRKEVLKSFKDLSYDPIQVAYPLQIKKPWRNYSIRTVPAHVRAALYSNKFLNTDFEFGDKPRRLPIKTFKLKVDKAQSTLFGGVSYPSMWQYKERIFLLRDISIAEDMDIPEWFIKRIDWKRIVNRLTDKMNRITVLLEGFNEMD